METVRTILLLKTDGTAVEMPVAEGSMALRTLQQAVEGRIELVHPPRLVYPYVMAVNEEGWTKGLKENPIASWLCCRTILGPAAILMEEQLEDGETDLLGLLPKLAEILMDYLAPLVRKGGRSIDGEMALDQRSQSKGASGAGRVQKPEPDPTMGTAGTHGVHGV